MERIVGLDVGDRRIGIAVSDELGMIAQPIGTLSSTGWGPDVRYIKNLADSYGARRVVCGLPQQLDGSEGPQAEKVRAFGRQLEKAGLTVEYWDERLTSVSAERALLEGGLSRKDRRAHIDKTAAALILQSYMDANSRPKEEEISMSETQENIVELIGEDGEAVSFEHLMTLDYEGNNYIVLTPVPEDDQSEEADVIIMRVSKDENDVDCYLLVEDEAILQAVFDRFVELIEEEDDAIPSDEDESDE